jgi:hypothetical protein
MFAGRTNPKLIELRLVGGPFTACALIVKRECSAEVVNKQEYRLLQFQNLHVFPFKIWI